MSTGLLLSLVFLLHQATSDPLMPLTLQPLPTGTVMAEGWLQQQLRIQSDGLSGHLDKFWPDIQHSGWIGGDAEGWERAPYWLDGLVPLAWSLPDTTLQKTVHFWMDYILEHQHEDGWLGPRHSAGYQELDTWPQFVILKALRQYHEVTGDKRVLPAMMRNVRCINRVLAQTPLFDWGKYRWMDLVVTLHWLYEQSGEADLLTIAQQAAEQGFSWRKHFEDFKFPDKMDQDACIFDTHVVNNAMSVKASAVWYRQSKDPGDLQGVQTCLDTLDKYHGQATGIFTGDEHYAGKNPSQGTELCAVVEYMFSLETLLSHLGRPEDADRLERIAYNALPGTFSPDMWAHQYDQQANQAICRISEDRIYTTNGRDSNIFGLEPNYGCCTSNMHQGWPKFVSHLWMKTPAEGDQKEGLAAVTYGPCRLKTTVNTLPFHVLVDTAYPFEENIRIVLEGTGSFPLSLRVPAWAEGATVQVEEEDAVALEPGSFFVLDRSWQDITEIKLHFPMQAVSERRFNNSATLSRGPLVYSLAIGTEWRCLRGEVPHADYELHPTTPWNYALVPNFMEKLRFETTAPVANPFDPATPAVQAWTEGRLLPEWTLYKNAAAPPPVSPVTSSENLTELKLIPYGAAKLRITEFPVLVP